MANGDQLFDTPSQTQRRSGRYILIFVILLIIIIASVGAYQYLSSQQKSIESDEITPTPTEFVFPTDTPTPMATPTGDLTPTKSAPKATSTPRPAGSTIDKTTGLDRSKLTIEILNGSGTAGVAKKASDTLTELGYQVLSTGNADNYNYETTVIEVKSAKSSYLPLLKSDLSTTYTIGETSSSLSATSSADARVIVGKK